jgi:hypothetical protein
MAQAVSRWPLTAELNYDTTTNPQYHIIFTVHFCTIDQLTPTNAPNQVLSLISLLKDYPNTHFGTSTLPSSGGLLKFYIDQCT